MHYVKPFLHCINHSSHRTNKVVYLIGKGHMIIFLLIDFMSHRATLSMSCNQIAQVLTQKELQFITWWKLAITKPSKDEVVSNLRTILLDNSWFKRTQNKIFKTFDPTRYFHQFSTKRKSGTQWNPYDFKCANGAMLKSGELFTHHRIHMSLSMQFCEVIMLAKWGQIPHISVWFVVSICQ